jgi:hypothetical protein
MHKKLKIPLNLPFKNGEIKIKNFFNFPSPFDGKGGRGECEGIQEAN